MMDYLRAQVAKPGASPVDVINRLMSAFEAVLNRFPKTHPVWDIVYFWNLHSGLTEHTDTRHDTFAHGRPFFDAQIQEAARIIERLSAKACVEVGDEGASP